jgi:hypothetical protein
VDITRLVGWRNFTPDASARAVPVLDQDRREVIDGPRGPDIVRQDRSDRRQGGPLPELGVAKRLQLVPAQCSINVAIELPDVCWPTAHTSLLATPPTTPNSPPATDGVEMTLQLFPSKCSASVALLLALLPDITPTAQLSLSLMAATPLRLELLTNGLGTMCRPCCPKAWPGLPAIIPIASNPTNMRVRGAFTLQQLTSALVFLLFR